MSTSHEYRSGVVTNPKQTDVNLQRGSVNNSHPGDVVSSGQARAKRLKRLRKMTGKSRKSFSEQYTISQGTLQNWETARFGGLTEKGARIVLDALRQEGIHCSFEWLMYGGGVGPSLSVKLNQSDPVEISALQSFRKKVKLSRVEDEMEVFYQLHANAVHFVVQDDTMQPQYREGEWVVGIKVFGDEISSLTGNNCIVETHTGDVLFRYLKAGSSVNLYDLICLNSLTRHRHVALYDEALFSAAPIVWTRCEDVW